MIADFNTGEREAIIAMLYEHSAQLPLALCGIAVMSSVSAVLTSKLLDPFHLPS